MTKYDRKKVETTLFISAVMLLVGLVGWYYLSVSRGLSRVHAATVQVTATIAEQKRLQALRDTLQTLELGRLANHLTLVQVQEDLNVQKLESVLRQVSLVRLQDRLALLHAQQKLLGYAKQKLENKPTDADRVEASVEETATGDAIAKLQESVDLFEEVVKNSPAPPQARELLATARRDLEAVGKEVNGLKDLNKVPAKKRDAPAAQPNK